MFEKWEFWKHENNKDVFIWLPKNFSYSVNKQGDVTIPVRWCIQGTSNWWLAYSPFKIEQIVITTENFDKWHQYLPKP